MACFYGEDSGPMVQWRENESSWGVIEARFTYGLLTVVRYEHFLANGGDEARMRSHFPLQQRLVANGLKPSTVHKGCSPRDATAISAGDQHSVSYAHTNGSTTVVQYAPDSDTDMFQIGRFTESPIDFVVSDALPDSESAVSRFACRIVCQRSPPYAARIYAAGFDSSKKIVLGESKCWTMRDGQMDGLTTNGVLLLRPPRGFPPQPSPWRVVSVCGNVFAHSGEQQGKMVDSESNELVDGSLIDLCGVTLQWRTAEGLAIMPTTKHLEVQRGPELFPGRPCYAFVKNCIYGGLLADLAWDAKDYGAESWCQTVEPVFCEEQKTRQNVIYELMQTERNHLETLVVMAAVFRRGLRDEVGLDGEALERLFPRLHYLVLFHHSFYSALKERRRRSARPPGGHSNNYLVQHIGDILLKQFSDGNAQTMKQVYGDFYSRHNEAVGFFKELQNNREFRLFVKQQSNNSLIRRKENKEIPGCMLLVTQRITKYPALLERILKHTQVDTEEHTHMVRALARMREAIAGVELRVSEYEQDRRLQDVLNGMDGRSSAKLRNGQAFRKHDLACQTHKHQGRLRLKTANLKFKDVLVLLLSDTLVFLEGNQKYTFATMDGKKPPVVSLRELSVAKVANEERGMFLISQSGAGALEVYEVLAAAQDDRNTWMRLITEAIETCNSDTRL